MKRILSFLLITLLFATTTAKAASYIQAIWTANNKTLTFHYGALYSKGGTYNGQTISAVWTGTAVNSTGNAAPGWLSSVKGTMTTVVFEPTFTNVTLKSCYSWFSGCTKLTTITGLSYLNTASVTNMASMFNGCTGFTSLNLSTFNTAKVTNMSSMFSGCTKLKTLNLSSFTTSSVTQYSDMFASVPAQCFVYMPTETLAAIKSLRSKNLVLKDGSAWTCPNCEMNLNTEYSISYKFTATALTVKNSSSTVNLLYRNGSYYSTVSTKNVVLPAGTDKFVLPTAQAIWTEGNSTLTFTYAVPYSVGGTYGGQTITNVWSGEAVTATGTTNPGWTTDIYESVKKVTFTSAFKNVKPTSCNRWFFKFHYLDTITGLENLNTSECTTMRDMFYGCWQLTTLDLKTFNTAKVTSLEGLFNSCIRLISVNLSSFNTSNVTNMDAMFWSCKELTSIDVSSFNTSKVEYMRHMFEQCPKLTSLNLSNFNTESLKYTSTMFKECTSLMSIDLSSFNTSKVTDSENMFLDLANQCFVYMPTGTLAGIKSQRSKNLVLKDGSNWTCASCEMDVNTDYAVLYKFTASSLTVKNATSTTYHLYNNGTLYSTVGKSNVVIPAGTDKFAEVTAQAIWTEGNTTLTFYNGEPVSVGGTYGGQTVTKVWSGTAVTATGTKLPGWAVVKGSCTAVKFDTSFKNVKPTSLYYWFGHFEALASITGIANLNTSSVTNMAATFLFCNSLTSLDVSGFQTSNVTSMHDMFCECRKLTNIDVSKFNTAKVTQMAGMFEFCESLTNINVSSFNTAKVTNMQGMFNGCSSLTALDISNFNTANVTTMGYEDPVHYNDEEYEQSNANVKWYYGGMFQNCSSLTSLNLGNFNTAKVTDFDQMFYGCSSLTGIDLSQMSSASTTSCSNMFQSVPAQCFVYMPAAVSDAIKSQRSKNLVLKSGTTWTSPSFEMAVDKDYNISFQFKAATLTVTGSSATAFCLYKDGAMYSTVANLANVTIPKGKDKISATFPAMAIWTEGNTTLTFLAADKYKAGDTYNSQTITNVWKGTAITASADTPAWLSTVKGTVTKVVFDASFKNVKPTKCLNWFRQCGKLATITGIGNLNTSEVTTMQQMFRECPALTSLNLSTFNTQKVTTMRSMFYGCTGLTSLNLSSFNTAAITNMGYMFCNCSKLTSIDVSKFNTANVTAMDGLFYGCSGLTSLDLTNFNTAKVTTIKDMFRVCSKLTSIDLSSFNTAAVTDMTSVFFGCSGLTSLDLTNFNTAKVTTMTSMFRGCSKLMSIDASNFTSEALTTYTTMFTYVPDLCFVYMPAGLPDDLKSQKAKNLVLKDGSKWTCDNCWMTINKTYDILYNFTAASFTADGPNATRVVLYNNDVPFTDIYNFANESIPKGTDRLSDYSGPQVVWTAGNTTLTFISSENFYGPGDTFNGETVTDVWISFNTEEISTPKWLSTVQGALTHVVFDNSFASYLPPSCSRWFKDCGQLTTVSGWENLQTSECISFLEMFKNCEKLESVEVSHFDTSKCTRFQDMFQRCSSLTTIDVSNFDTSKATSIGGMFAYCTGLTELDLSSFNTEKVIDFGWLVRECTNLRSLDLSNFKTGKYRTVSVAFQNVSEQCFIFIPEGQWDNFNQAKTDNLVLKKSDGTFECDNCVLTDGETLTLPHGFTALGGVKYERTIPANTGEASAVFLPYNSMIPEGVTAYTLKTSEQKHLSKDKVMFEPVNGSVMEAYTPYLIINRGADLTDLNTTTDTQVLPTTTAPAEKSFGDLRFTGTVQTLSNEEAVAMQAYSMQDGNQWKKVTASSAEGIPAYRAFLVSPSFSASTLKAVFPLPGDANDDGNVTVTDIAVVVNEILQLPNTDISTDNADANSDGQITVTDIGVIVDMILGNTAASSRKLQGLEPQ